ncbi:LysR family transcriptional regulator [Acidaminococcus intestini]|nr:LysR family transcriptional regulator [Acidaminococcus intestini]
MDFRDLTYLLAIARQQNITRAAESLYLSQPTLSKFLKGLEGELGLPLFERLGNKYIPTYAGEQYIKKPRKSWPSKRTRSADGRYHKKQ